MDLFLILGLLALIFTVAGVAYAVGRDGAERRASYTISTQRAVNRSLIHDLDVAREDMARLRRVIPRDPASGKWGAA